MAPNDTGLNRQQRRAQQRGAESQAAGVSYPQAVAAFQSGDFMRARALAEQLVMIGPGNGDHWNLMALVANAQGRVAEAAQHFRKALALAPDASGLMNNLGLLLFQQGELAEAEALFRKAIAADANAEDAIFNLANLCATARRFDEAESYYQRAMRLAPSKPLYHLQMGKIMKLKGRPLDAAGFYQQAVALARPHPQLADLLAESLLRLANALLDAGRRVESIPFFYEAIQRGAGQAAAVGFASAIGWVRVHEAHPEFKPILARAFRELWVPPANLTHVAYDLLAFETPLRESLEAIRTCDASTLLQQPCIRALVTEELLLAMMQATAISDAPLEQVLTACRRALLFSETADDNFLPFAAAMALQCFANEYAFAETPEETAAVTTLEALCTDSIASLTPMQLAVLASYRPLYQQAFPKLILARTWPDALTPLITQQLREPLAEAGIRLSIEAVTPIRNAISEAVRGQYEEHPYPRWVAAASHRENLSVAKWLYHYFPYAPAPELPFDGTLDILIAGCGTGQQSVATSLRFADAQVLAVDLSLSSLSYAMRKTQELGIQNIRYAQGDILELGALDRQFDIVECGGVLHHLEDPLKGWQVLAGLTKPGGYMSIALYSELARKPLIAAREFAREHGINGITDLREYRAQVMALPADHPAASVAANRDFYTLSMLRDLVFHVQEHRYTIARLKNEIATLGLQFHGFNIPPELNLQFQSMFGSQADLLSLDLWEKFEEAHPATFIGMYQFLVHKPLA